MGCCLSCLSTPEAKHTPSRQPYNLENQAVSGQQGTKNWTIVTPPSRHHDGYANTNPPPYRPMAQDRSAELILNVFQRGLSLHSRDTVNAFNSCKHRRFKIWIDTNPVLERVTRMAIQLFALNLLLIGQGTMCDMEFHWMGHNNFESRKIGKEGCGKAKALSQLMKTDNWETACNMISTESELKGLGLEEWLENETGQSAGSQRHSTDKAIRPSLNVESAQETHSKLLSQARSLMTQYFAGWELKDIDMEKFIKLDREAAKETKQQTQIRNHVSFTYKKEIDAYKRETERGGEGTPTTVVLLVASPMVEAEKNSIIECLKDAESTSKLSRNTATRDMFCIQTLAFTDFMERPAVKLLQDIDDACKGDRDINDLTTVRETSLLEYGPSENLFEKVLNSHLRSVDGLNMAPKDMYGKDKLSTVGSKIWLPDVEEVMRIFGRRDDSSEDGDDYVIQAPGANQVLLGGR